MVESARSHYGSIHPIYAANRYSELAKAGHLHYCFVCETQTIHLLQRHYHRHRKVLRVAYDGLPYHWHRPLDHSQREFYDVCYYFLAHFLCADRILDEIVVILIESIDNGNCFAFFVGFVG